jgi:predicted RNA binding protein YcfA (HicA-like mRNA interferase family)
MRRRKRADAELPRVLNQQSFRELLKKHGWTRECGGKHNVKMTKPGQRPITLPYHRGRDYGRDLRDRLLREAGFKGAERKGGAGWLKK